MISSRRSAPYHNHVLTSAIARAEFSDGRRDLNRKRGRQGFAGIASHILLHDRRAGDIISSKGLSAISP